MTKLKDGYDAVLLHTSFSSLKRWKKDIWLYLYSQKTLHIVTFVMCSAERWSLQPGGEFAVTQSISSEQQIQEDVSLYGHKMVLLLSVPLSSLFGVW